MRMILRLAMREASRFAPPLSYSFLPASEYLMLFLLSRRNPACAGSRTQAEVCAGALRFFSRLFGKGRFVGVMPPQGLFSIGA